MGVFLLPVYRVSSLWSEWILWVVPLTIYMLLLSSLLHTLFSHLVLEIDHGVLDKEVLLDLNADIIDICIVVVNDNRLASRDL